MIEQNEKDASKIETALENLEMEIVELLDLEEHSKQGKSHTPRAKRYRLRIDDDFYETEKRQLTGTEILALAGKTPAKYNLRLRLHGNKVEPIAPDYVVHLHRHGIERFSTLPKENSEGEGEAAPAIGQIPKLRRKFELREVDRLYLDANHPRWETIMHGNVPVLILNDFPVPAGYSHTLVKAAVFIPTGYPVTALDMVYFFPPLSRSDKRPINALSDRAIEGAGWQQWSRHYAWRAGVDDLTTHVERIKSWLEEQLLK